MYRYPWAALLPPMIGTVGTFLPAPELYVSPPRGERNGAKYRDRSKYMPHQGEQEKARRRRQMSAQ